MKTQINLLRDLVPKKKRSYERWVLPVSTLALLTLLVMPLLNSQKEIQRLEARVSVERQKLAQRKLAEAQAPKEIPMETRKTQVLWALALNTGWWIRFQKLEFGGADTKAKQFTVHGEAYSMPNIRNWIQDVREQLPDFKISVEETRSVKARYPFHFKIRLEPS